MPSFSERNGFESPRVTLQVDSLDSATRTRIWSILHIVVQTPFLKERRYEAESGFFDFLWINYLQIAVDERPDRPHQCWQVIKNHIISGPFNDVMDCLEFIVEALNAFESQTDSMRNASAGVVETLNHTFERYLVGFRFVDGLLVQIDSAEEVSAINAALDGAQPLQVAHHHLVKALAALSDRDEPNYPHVIRESIQAVESAVRVISGKEKFSDAINMLPKLGFPTHGALISSWLKMYGWSSNESGLRHAGETVANIDQALAKYVFGTSASFVAYLADESRKLGLPKDS